MNLWVLILNYLKSRPLNTALNILLLALGIAMISILVVFNRQFQEKITSNSKGIDLVVGAKGSPMQLILCNIFHVDFPTGNIRLVEAERVARHRLVKRAIPLALGDNYRGFRIIGTSHDYADLYDAKLSQGSLWKEPMEVVIGSDVARALQLSLGSQFTSSHGLSDETHAHDEQQFVVKGILQKANNVVDNLILTGVESIWQVHAVHDETTSSEQSPVRDSSGSSLVPSVAQGDSSKEITAMLVQYRSAMGAIRDGEIIFDIGRWG
jgi:putative ABC transport system permease protein